MFTVYRNVLIDFPSLDNPLSSIVVVATPCHPCHPCVETLQISWSKGKMGWLNSWHVFIHLSVSGSSPQFDAVERPESIFSDLSTSATLTFICSSVFATHKTFKCTSLSIGYCNWNSKQLVQRLSSLVTSTYFIMRLDSFIMRAVWLIFAPWCPPNV